MNLLILFPKIVISNEIIGYHMEYSSEDNYINIWPKSMINYDTGKQMSNLSAYSDQMKVFAAEQSNQNSQSAILSLFFNIATLVSK